MCSPSILGAFFFTILQDLDPAFAFFEVEKCVSYNGSYSSHFCSLSEQAPFFRKEFGTVSDPILVNTFTMSLMRLLSLYLLQTLA